MIKLVAVNKSTNILMVKYYARNPEKNPSFFILFLLDNIDSLIYLAIINIYLILIVEFALYPITIAN